MNEHERASMIGKVRASAKSCDCNDCRQICRHHPGPVFPFDLDRMIPDGADPFAWTEEHLLASEGNLLSQATPNLRLQPYEWPASLLPAWLAKDRYYYRVPVMIPSRFGHNRRGACHWFAPAGAIARGGCCLVHATRPHGCAQRLLCGQIEGGSSGPVKIRGYTNSYNDRAAIRLLVDAWDDPASLYRRLWLHLFTLGLIAPERAEGLRRLEDAVQHDRLIRSSADAVNAMDEAIERGVAPGEADDDVD